MLFESCYLSQRPFVATHPLNHEANNVANNKVAILRNTKPERGLRCVYMDAFAIQFVALHVRAYCYGSSVVFEGRFTDRRQQNISDGWTAGRLRPVSGTETAHGCTVTDRRWAQDHAAVMQLTQKYIDEVRMHQSLKVIDGKCWPRRAGLSCVWCNILFVFCRLYAAYLGRKSNLPRAFRRWELAQFCFLKHQNYICFSKQNGFSSWGNSSHFPLSTPWILKLPVFLTKTDLSRWATYGHRIRQITAPADKCHCYPRSFC